MPENNTATSDEGWDTTLSEGEEASEESSEEEGEENTAEDVAQNNPEDNKKLSELTMSEQLRQTYNLKLMIPRILKGLNTNQFFFIEVADEFYENNYPEIIKAIANKKFARFAGFEKGRFFVEKVEEKGGMDGWSTTITLNPIPPSLAIYSKMQKDAQKALVQAINWELSLMGGGGGGLTTTNGSDCTGETLHTYNLAVTSYDINEAGSKIIGNSSANYAQDTAGMDAKSALMDIYHRFSYDGYDDNAQGHCPQEMWNKDGTISGNCADISRLCMAMGQVHGLKIGIHHMSGHYYNLVEVDGKTYRFDCCCKSTGSYGGERTNDLCMNGGPWS